MIKEEFEKMIREPINDYDYRDVELVYMWHPSISETNGKEQMVFLYKEFGMPLIREMTKNASIMHDLCKEKECLMVKINEIDKKIELIKNGKTID